MTYCEFTHGLCVPWHIIKLYMQLFSYSHMQGVHVAVSAGNDNLDACHFSPAGAMDA